MADEELETQAPELIIGPESVSLEDFESQEEPVVEEPKTGILDSNDPQLIALREALRISEEARRSTEEKLRGTPAPAAPAPVRERGPRAEDLFTDEQLAEMLNDDPVKALRAIQSQTLKYAEQHYGAILESASTSGVGVAEQMARTKYADEFELFGDEISTFVKNAPNKSAFSNVDAWQDLVSYIRGKPGNIEKYVERLQSKGGGKGPAEARAAERANAGFTPRSTVKTPSSASNAGDGTYGLDATERKVADTMGISYADYHKWKRV